MRHDLNLSPDLCRTPVTRPCPAESRRSPPSTSGPRSCWRWRTRRVSSVLTGAVAPVLLSLMCFCPPGQVTHLSNGLPAAGKKLPQTFTNYASVECGAKILSSNPEAKVRQCVCVWITKQKYTL